MSEKYNEKKLKHIFIPERRERRKKNPEGKKEKRKQDKYKQRQVIAAPVMTRFAYPMVLWQEW